MLLLLRVSIYLSANVVSQTKLGVDSQIVLCRSDAARSSGRKIQSICFIYLQAIFTYCGRYE